MWDFCKKNTLGKQATKTKAEGSDKRKHAEGKATSEFLII